MEKNNGPKMYFRELRVARTGICCRRTMSSFEFWRLLPASIVLIFAIAGCAPDVRILGTGGDSSGSSSTGGDGNTGGEGGSGGAIMEHPCPPAPCAATECIPEIISAPVAGAVSVGPVVNSGYVYWASKTMSDGASDMWNVYRIPKCGGLPEEVAAGASRIDDMVTADGTNVFFSEFGTPPNEDPNGGFKYHGAIWHAGDSILAERIVTGLASPSYLAVDDINIYWRALLSEVHRASRMGGEPEVLLIDNDAWIGIDVDELNVYWGGVGAVRKANKSKPVAIDVLPVDLAGAVVVEGDELYVLDLGGTGAPHRILRAGLDGSNATVLVEGSFGPQMLVDGSWIYYHGSGGVWRVGKSSGAPLKLVDATYWSDLASDEKYLYWYENGIVRLPKPSENQ